MTTQKIKSIRYMPDCPLKQKVGEGTISLRKCRECKHHRGEIIKQVNCDHGEDQP